MSIPDDDEIWKVTAGRYYKAQDWAEAHGREGGFDSAINAVEAGIATSFLKRQDETATFLRDCLLVELNKMRDFVARDAEAKRLAYLACPDIEDLTPGAKKK